jgi:tryptophan 7-halogenase
MRIVIVGGGTAGWLSALNLSTLIGSAITSVALIEDIGQRADPAPPAYIALPATLRALEKASLSEADLICKANASVHLGYAFSGWQGDETTQFIATGAAEAPLGPVSFLQLALRRQAEGTPIRLADYSLEAICAQSERFAPASNDQRSVLSTLSHGLHIEAAGLTALLRERALAKGVISIEGTFVSTRLDSHGDVSSLEVSGHDPIRADLYIDCSGSQRLLSNRPALVWPSQLPWTSFKWASRPRLGPSLPLFVHAQAAPDGYALNICTSANQYQLRATLQTQDTSPPVGRLTQVWCGNRVAIGRAAANLPLVAGLELHTIAAGIDQLITHLPATASTQFEAGEYNRIFCAQLDQAYLWSLLPFALNTRVGETFWDQARAARDDSGLSPILERWTKLGRIAITEFDWFDDYAWAATFTGGGLWPARYDQVANGFDIDVITAHLQKVRSIMIAAVGTLPPHLDYLNYVVGNATKAEPT